MKQARILIYTFVSFVIVLAHGGIVRAETVTVHYGGTKVIQTDSLSEARSVAADSAGNVYIAGTASDIDGSINFNPGGSDNKPISFGTDIFLTKWNADATYGWTRVIGGGGTNAAYDVAVDSAGNVIVVGSFAEANLNFNPSGSDLHSTAGSDDIFVSKWSAAGAHQWTKSFGGTSSDEAQSVAVDAGGSIYVAGSFRGTVNFNPAGIDNHTSGGSVANAFITKLESTGAYHWTRTFTSASANEANAITANGTALFVTGTFRASTDFDPTAGMQQRTPVGSGDVFLASLNTDGNYRWVKTFGGNNFEEGLGVASSGADVYISGYIASANVNFNQDGSDVKSVNGSDNAFLSKWSSSGTYGWTRLIGNSSASAHDVATDTSGDAYLVGTFSGTNTNFNPTGSDLRSSSPSDQDIFITRFNADGNYGWTKTSIGGDFNYAHGIAVGANNAVHTVGQLYSDASGTNFNQDGSDVFGNGSTFDIFYTKWDQTIEQFITNPPADITIVDGSGNNLVSDGAPQAASVSVQLRDSATAAPIVDVQLNLSSDIDWGGVTVGLDDTSGKAFVSGLGAATGSLGSHTLYIPKLTGQTMVTICPHATSLAEVSPTCQDAMQYTASSQNVSIQSVGGKDYWVVSGLSGTGGVGGVLDATSQPASPASSAAEPLSPANLANTGSTLLVVLTTCLLLIATSYGVYRKKAYVYSCKH